MSCNDKPTQRCKKVYAKCTMYEGTLPDISGLVNSTCINIEEVAEDLYDIVQNLSNNQALQELSGECLTLPSDKSIPTMFQFLINTICSQQATIADLLDLTGTHTQQITDLQNNNCG